MCFDITIKHLHELSEFLSRFSPEILLRLWKYVKYSREVWPFHLITWKVYKREVEFTSLFKRCTQCLISKSNTFSDVWFITYVSYASFWTWDYWTAILGCYHVNVLVRQRFCGIRAENLLSHCFVFKQVRGLNKSTLFATNLQGVIRGPDFQIFGKTNVRKGHAIGDCDWCIGKIINNPLLFS